MCLFKLLHTVLLCFTLCTTSYLPNALQSAAKKEELTAASPPDVKIGAKTF